MKKAVTFVLLICVCITFFSTGCGTTPQSSTTTAGQTATVQSDSSQTEQSTAATPKISGSITAVNNRVDQVDALNKIADAFHTKYPDATVTIEALKDWGTTEKVRLASNEAPDLIMIDKTIIPTSKQYPDFLLPLDDMGYNKDTIAFYDDYVFEGKHYGLVDGIYITGLLYSKKTMQAAGISGPPKTLDELYAALDIFKAKGILPLGSMVKSKWPLTNWTAVRNVYETKTGADYWNQFTASDAPFTKDSAVGKEMEFIKTLKDKGYFDTNPASSDWDMLRLAMDKVGFLMLANYGIGALANEKPEDIGFCPLPADNSGKTYATSFPAQCQGISKNTKSPDAAKAFLKFWLEESKFNDVIGVMPSVKSVKSGVPQLAEFMAANPVIFEEPTSTDDFTMIVNKAQISSRFEELMQEVIVSGDIDKTFDKYNKKWADAKKVVGK